MAEPGEARVAVYLDFDNIVISHYDEVHGRGAFGKDRARESKSSTSETGRKLLAAVVDVGAVIDFAASFGTLVLTRAYADWSVPINAAYQRQLVARAVDLVQLFPAAAYAKNGADIRLAVDAVEDMFRLPDLTHVVIVAGDSDYVPLAQRCKRLGRYVVGIGVAGSTAKSLAAACDEFYSYNALPGIEVLGAPEPPAAPKDGTTEATAAAESAEGSAVGSADGEAETGETKAGSRRGRSKRAGTAVAEAPAPDPQLEAAGLLERALRIGQEKSDAEWQHLSELKNQMKRMDPSFNEKALGFSSFSDFVKAHPKIAALDESSTARMVRLADAARRGRRRRVS
ncbi:MAG TPA: NYN domain-containing protein [Gryllotalpicola sp.]